MWEQILETAANSGIWSLLFVALFCFQIKDSKSREQKYQETISSLADKLTVVNAINDVVGKIASKLGEDKN